MVNKNNDDEQCICESAAGGSSPCRKTPRWFMERSSEARRSFTTWNTNPSSWRNVKDLVKKHSEFIGFPIELFVQKSKEKDVTDSEEDEEERGR